MEKPENQTTPPPDSAQARPRLPDNEISNTDMFLNHTTGGMVPPIVGTKKEKDVQEKVLDEKKQEIKLPKKKENLLKTLLRILIALLLIGAGIFVVLFCVAKAAKYDSIVAMLQHMSGEVSLMWQRITA